MPGERNMQPKTPKFTLNLKSSSLLAKALSIHIRQSPKGCFPLTWNRNWPDWIAKKSKAYARCNDFKIQIGPDWSKTIQRKIFSL